jgi:hypothetical protein
VPLCACFTALPAEKIHSPKATTYLSHVPNFIIVYPEKEIATKINPYNSTDAISSALSWELEIKMAQRQNSRWAIFWH